jgi:transposase
LETNPCQFHFVGGLRLNQCPELLDIPKADYTLLDASFGGTSAYRTVKRVYDKDFTVVATNNPELFEAQMRGILSNIASCEKALAELRERLCLREAGLITKGKKPTVESVNKNVTKILSAEYMKEIFDFTVSGGFGQTPKISFSLNGERLTGLQERVLGKTILFTDQSDWSNEQIVKAYRSQYHVEDAFKQMKDTKYLSFRPMRHFTDDNIRVHAFYCVLALTLTCLLNKELENMGYKMSIRRMLDIFQCSQQVISVYSVPKGKPIAKTAYSRLDGVTKDYFNKHSLLKLLE